jgi:F0F1-type ATP synthase delta subunit
VGKDGGLISMTTVNVHDDTFEKIRDYQFRQSVPGQATLSVIPLENLTESEKKHIVEGMNKRLQGQITIKLEIQSELLQTGRGKISRVVKEGQLSLNDTAKKQGTE